MPSFVLCGATRIDVKRELCESPFCFSDQIVISSPLRRLPDEVARVEAAHQRGELELVAARGGAVEHRQSYHARAAPLCTSSRALLRPRAAARRPPRAGRRTLGVLEHRHQARDVRLRDLPNREPGGGWALGSQACIVNKKIKVDKQAELFSMGFYEKIKKQTQ